MSDIDISDLNPAEVAAVEYIAAAAESFGWNVFFQSETPFDDDSPVVVMGIVSPAVSDTMRLTFDESSCGCGGRC